MSLQAGDKLGPYEILEPLGAGGMGEVYRAHDPRTARDVAVKIADEEFSERFSREVRAVAALNHPNICHLYDVGPNYLVMELVEGPTLADRIAPGPIPLKEALEIARQIAGALEAAHGHGIVHRDLKPANIKLKPDGTVKVLDFGLAKFGAAPEASAIADGRTMTMGATQAGAILGTPAYMSPEQARGAMVDRRTDTWAFGAVLYEILAGRPAFEGQTVTDVLAAVIQRDPDWTRVAEPVRPLLQHCLEKDPKLRLREPADGLLLLEPGAQAAPTPARTPFGLISSIAAAVFLLALAALSFIHFREKPRADQVVRFQFSLPPNTTFSRSGIFAISPDGSKVAFSAFGTDGIPRIWIRDMDSLAARPLANLATAQGMYALFWSPDSRSLAVQSEGKLKKIDVAGGAAQEICDAQGTVFGGSWSRDNVILFASSDHNGIVRAPASTGSPTPVATFTKGERFLPIYPVFLSDGRHFLYSRGGGADKRAIFLGSLDAKPEEQNRAALMKTDYSFAYVPGSGGISSHVLFLNAGTLFAQSFDEKKMALAGEPVRVADEVASDDGPALGYLSASENGSLVYLSSLSRNLQLTWFNRLGEATGKPAESGFSGLRLSPDGTKAAVVQAQVFAGQSSIWVIDLIHGTNSRFTFGSNLDAAPVWSPDGGRIAWRSVRNGKSALYQKAANGAGNEELLYQFGEVAPAVWDWSRDGRFIIYGLNRDLWALPVGPGSGSDRKPVALIQSPETKTGAYLSPDGRWLAYMSNETGRMEIYVQGVNLYSPNGGKWMVSKGALGLPRWRADGKELLYLGSDGGLMSVALAGGALFQPGPPQLLFKLPPTFLGVSVNSGTMADVTRDNQKILVSLPIQESGRQALSVVLNWQAGLAK